MSESSDLAIPGTLTETSLDLPATLGRDEAAECGRVLLRMHESACWWLGDWFNWIQRQFPDDWPQLVEANEYQETTLRKWGWMCRSVPRGTREASLSPRHHELVAHLPEPEQKKYLQEAKPEAGSTTPRQSTRELSEKIKADREPESPEKNVETIHKVSCPDCGVVFALNDANTFVEEV